MESNSIVSSIFRKKSIYKNGDATLNLLSSSILVSISGAMRVYLACILVSTQINLLICMAGFFIIYSVYTLDRSLDAKEDAVNRTELKNSNKKAGLLISFFTFVIGAYFLSREGMLTLAFMPILTGYLYSKGVTIGKFSLKLKGGLGMKNIVVGLTWGIFIAGLTGCTTILPLAMVFILYGMKVFINSTIDDFKDVIGDEKAGIRTLPLYLGTERTRTLLVALHLISHIIVSIAMLSGIISYEFITIIISFICGTICIYANRELLPYFKDLESTFTIILIGILKNVA